MRSRVDRVRWLVLTVAFALLLSLPHLVTAATVVNPLCSGEDVTFNPGNGEDIVVPPGFKVSVFVTGLNAPTAVAFRGSAKKFEVFVLESGHGLPSICNDEVAFQTAHPSAPNPFTPDILVFDQSGRKIAGPLGKPTDATTVTGGTGVFQPHGPAIDIAFERGFQGGRLFASDSNQSLRTSGNNNSSRIVTVNPETGRVTPFITGLPTGDHPAEQITFKDDHIYWSQGSTTNSGVVGRDNGGGANQQDIPCQDIQLSDNVFDSGGGVKTSGYSPFGVQRKGATGKAFDSATGPGICDGALWRAAITAADVPVRRVLDHPPQPITAPLALESADVAIVGVDFVPDSFVHGPVKRGAALAGREGDFGFAAANGNPEEGHDIQLITFKEPLQLQLQRFAFNTTFEQAFVSGARGINRPVDLKFGPDDCAYLVDYGAVRDFGQSDQ